MSIHSFGFVLGSSFSTPLYCGNGKSLFIPNRPARRLLEFWPTGMKTHLAGSLLGKSSGGMYSIESSESISIIPSASSFLGGLSLHLNHLIGSHVTNYDWPFGTLPFGLFGSNLDTRDLETYPRTYSGHF